MLARFFRSGVTAAAAGAGITYSRSKDLKIKIHKELYHSVQNKNQVQRNSISKMLIETSIADPAYDISDNKKYNIL